MVKLKQALLTVAIVLQSIHGFLCSLVVEIHGKVKQALLTVAIVLQSINGFLCSLVVEIHGKVKASTTYSSHCIAKWRSMVNLPN